MFCAYVLKTRRFLTPALMVHGSRPRWYTNHVYTQHSIFPLCDVLSGCATPISTTLASLGYWYSFQGKLMTPTWFEHATFWSGVRRATVAPRSLHAGLRVWIALDHGTAHMNNYIVLCRRPLIKSVHQAIKSCTIRYVHYSMREKKCWPRGRPRFSSLFVSRPRWSSG